MTNNSRHSSKANRLAVVRPPAKGKIKRQAKRKKAQAAALEQRSETVRAPDPAARLICIDINKDQGGVETFEKLLVELGSLKKTWRTVKGIIRHRRYFSPPPFPIPQDTNGEILGPGVSILPTSFKNVTEPNGSAPRAGFSWVKGRSPTEIKLKKLSPAWEQRIGERMVAAVKASAVMGPTSAGSGSSDDAGRRIAEQVLQRFYAGGKHLIALGDEFMAYRKEGVWQPLGRQILEQRILDVVPSTPGVRQGKHATIKREVVDLLFAMQARDDDPFRRQSDPMRVINCCNGEVWLLDNGDVDFRRHSATSYLEHQVKIDYDPDATCPLYDQALRGIFAKTLFPKIMIRHWHELVGYIIQPQRDHAIVPILFGDGNNGKTRLIQTVARLLGNDLVCTGRVEELESNRFSLASLSGKRIFIDDDVHDGIKLPDGTLKTISERKLLMGELKHKNKFSFESRVVPVLLCNNVPNLTDVSRGMLRRLQVIPFDTTFTDKTADPNLFNKIWASELPGVLNRAIDGWQRLHERNRFKLPEPVVEATHRWLTYANPLAGFLEDVCRPHPQANVLLKDIYAAYCIWLKLSGITAVQPNAKVRLQLEQQGFVTKRSNKGVKVLGLRLKTPNHAAIRRKRKP